MDATLRTQTLRAAVRDSSFLKACFQDIKPELFPSREEQTIIQLAMDFWAVHKEPIGPLLRSDAEDAAIKGKFGADSKKKLRDLVDTLLGSKIDLVSVKALEERLARLKRTSFFENAVDQILTAQEKGELSADLLSSLHQRANIELSRNGHVSSYYASDMEKRIERRRRDALKRWPLFMIEPLDKLIKGLGRGRLGTLLAPSNVGKGVALVYFTGALAMQGFNVLHLTLEDPIQLVEDRLDASLTGMQLRKLESMPKRLRKRFEKVRKKIGERIRIVENLETAWTVSDIQGVWEYERKNGFIADAIVIDYDEFIEPDRRLKGDSAPRMEIQQIYTSLKQLAARLNVIMWTAAQATREAQGRKIITAKHVAEGFVKFRRVFMMIGIGEDPNNKKLKWLNVIKNREGRKDLIIPIMADYASALFFDVEATARYNKEQLAAKKAGIE